MTPTQEVRRFLASGDYNSLHSEWPGRDLIAKVRKAERTMKHALVAEIRHRETRRKSSPSLPPDFNASQFSLAKVEPMVRGLFPAREQMIVLGLFEKSLVFVTPDNIEQVIARMHWLGTAWQIANIYLGSLGLPGLDGKPVRLVGLSEETTFFVSMDYFEEENPFADYVAHEAAHVFHNWKRDQVGLYHTRKREFLLPIAFAKRELFAYACEAYSRILEQAKSPADRQRLHADYTAKWISDEDGIEQAELADVLAEAVATRNGWKRILRRCSHSDTSKTSRVGLDRSLSAMGERENRT